MKAKFFVTLALLFTLSLVCLLNCSALMYPEGSFDFTTLDTKRTLEAMHIVVGEVTHVSTVFKRGDYLPSSLVTVRIEKDIKHLIEHIENQGVKSDAEGERQKSPRRTVTFVQVGGPREDAGWVKVSGFPLLKQGDYVYLKLIPVKQPFDHGGHSIDSATSSFATNYTVLKDGADVFDYVIPSAWQRVDMTVLQIARVVRATHRKPERMRDLERRLSGLKHLAQDVRIQDIMNEVMDIEEGLNLPSLDNE